MLINNIETYNKFISYLNELNEGENPYYYVQYLFRRKYIEHDIKEFFPGEEKVGSFLVRLHNIKHELNKYNGLNDVFYTYKNSKFLILPNEHVTAYLNINPIDKNKLYKTTSKQILNDVLDGNYFNPNKYLDSNIPSSSLKRILSRFDFDNIELNDVIEQIEPYINLNAVSAICTKGGVHILIKNNSVDPQYAKKWHNNISALPIVDKQAKGIKMSPIPGTIQAGKLVDFITFK